MTAYDPHVDACCSTETNGSEEAGSCSEFALTSPRDSLRLHGSAPLLFWAFAKTAIVSRSACGFGCATNRSTVFVVAYIYLALASVYSSTLILPRSVLSSLAD